MKSNLYNEMQLRIEYRKMDRLVFRSMAVIVVLGVVMFGFLVAANLQVVLASY